MRKSRLETPAIVRWPGAIKGGGVSDELCGTFDVFATIAELAGAKLPTDRKIDGLSLVKILKGDPRAKGHEVFYYYNGLTLEVVRKGAIACGGRQKNKNSSSILRDRLFSI